METSPLASVRKTPEVILWALAIFVCGVVVLPLCHLVGHSFDHAHVRAHVAGAEHDEALHGEGDGLHFGLALLEGEACALLPPVGAWVPAPAEEPPEAPVRRSLLTPIRPGAP